MAKLTPEQLKQIRINNLSKGRMGKGRPRGSKNKITSKKVNEMIIKFLDQEENKNISKSDIINQELKIDLNDEAIHFIYTSNYCRIDVEFGWLIYKIS